MALHRTPAPRSPRRRAPAAAIALGLFAIGTGAVVARLTDAGRPPEERSAPGVDAGSALDDGRDWGGSRPRDPGFGPPWGAGGGPSLPWTEY